MAKVYDPLKSHGALDKWTYSVIFNLIYEYVNWMVEVNIAGNIYNRSVELMAFADDIEITIRSLRVLEEAFSQLQSGAEEFSLIVNRVKTLYIKLSWNDEY